MASTTYAKRFYVQLGSGGGETARTWSVSITAPDELVDLTAKGKTLREWITQNNTALPTSVGDEMWFAGGTYLSDINNTSTTTRMFSIRNGVKYYGGFAGTETSISDRPVPLGGNPWEFTYETIMDGQKDAPSNFTGAAQGMFAQFPSTLTYPVIFNGFTVKNFKRVMTASGAGGVLVMYNFANIQNCKFSDNVLTTSSNTLSNGGCVFGIQYNGTISPSSFENCYFGNNVSDRGSYSALMFGGVGVVQSAALIKGCTFEGNSSTSDYGGALIINQSNAYTSGGATIEDCIFKGNQAKGGTGGAIYIAQANATSPTKTETIKNCQFISNTCSTAGGTAIQVQNATKSILDIQGCTFAGNSSGVSGGVALNIASTTIQSLAPVKNCIFRDNSGFSTGTGTGDGVALASIYATTI